MGRRLWWVCGLACMGIVGGFLVAADKPAQTAPDPAVKEFDDASIEFFEKEVRPLLVSRCLECHGTGPGDPKGGLRLDSRAAAIKGGDTGPAVVPGKVKESLLVSAIEYGDLYQMPPKSKLPAKEIATLTKWVEMGAPWPKEKSAAAAHANAFDLAARKAGHWCWGSLTNPPVPEVNNKAWPQTPVDRFILAKLEQQKFTPAPPAEKHALLRRVYFDLVGLPPSPKEVEEFLQDSSPQALEKVVDRLLESVQYGERWGRHWLDLVRYAETRGHEFEPIIPNAWQYRDYVIRGINADVPYDRWLMEHIAGDLLEPRWRQEPASDGRPQAASRSSINEAILGTGFWFLGEEVHSPVDIRKDETDRMDNRLDVMTKTFLGLTVGCARCHDHKFDAISQRDYYALVGYLISGSYRQVRLQTYEDDRRIAEKLEAARAQTRRELAADLVATAKPTLDQLEHYLIAARELIEKGVSIEDVPTEGSSSQTTFADFEGSSWGDWKAEGTAFGDGPSKKNDNVYQAPLEGFRGERLVNSHRNATTGPNTAEARDARTGRLVSPTFVIRHNAISFLIGGGAHAGRTCMNLVIDGKAVRTATGENSGTLKSITWQVDDLRGQKAQLEIVDSEPGGWGHILVDEIVFLNNPAVSPASHKKRLTQPALTKLASLDSAKNLDVELLANWCIELQTAKSDRKHLLHSFATGAVVKEAPTPATPEGLVVNFGEQGKGDLIQDGVSFGLSPAGLGQLQFGTAGDEPRLHVTTRGAWTRDLFWKDQKLGPDTEDDYGTVGSWHRHGRMVRTPEFSLKADRLWYLVRGSIRAYATVNSHLVIGGPLHGGLLREFKHTDDQWHWVSHGLELYSGHRLHVEFCPADDGECSIAMVVQSHDAPALDEATASAWGGLNGSVAQQAKTIQQRLGSALTAFVDIQNTRVRDVKALAADAQLANWFVQRRELFGREKPQQVVRTHMASLHRQEADLRQQVRWESQLAPAMLDGNGVDEQLLVRGNSNTPRDPVHRRFLEALEEVPAAGPTATPGSGRVELARRMIDSPLTARVAVNRIWYHLFGRGIVPSVDNMGVLGQPATHPELLDHLANQFIKDGWSTKRLVKSLVLSSTYQMSSHPVEQDEVRDPDNLLWHRMSMKRLEGEVIRDSLLAVSGRLDRKSFGPSVPIHLTPFMEGRGRPGVSGPLDGNGRRSIYIAVRRNFLSPMMLAFDTPAPFSTVGRRTSSNVPAQALILMNDPLVVEMAKTWATQLLNTRSTTSERLDAMYMTAFARKATAQEKAEAVEFLEGQGAQLGLPERERQTSPLVWADLCHVIFNLKEFVFIE